MPQTNKYLVCYVCAQENSMYGYGECVINKKLKISDQNDIDVITALLKESVDKKMNKNCDIAITNIIKLPL